MVQSHIHPQAVVEEGAQVGNNVTVEPFAVVKASVTLEDNVTIKSHAYIDGDTTIGEGTVIYPSTSIGTKPQHLKAHGSNTKVIIGKHCEIREFVTINSSIEGGPPVTIGDHCLIMAYCHIAHNCTIGNRVVMANHATLAGHIDIEDFVVIGGMTPIHQFVRVGCYSMVGGLSRVTHDIPPYTLGAGIPYKFGGLNLIGLKRHGFSLNTRSQLSRAFRTLYRSGLHIDDALAKIESELDPLPEVEHWLSFCRSSKRGIMGLQGTSADKQDGATLLEDCISDHDEVIASSFQLN